jgi:hypothetical protein
MSSRILRPLLFLLSFFLVRSLFAQDTYVYTSYDFNLFPPYVALTAGSNEVHSGQLLAFRFKAQVTGVVDFVQTELYSETNTGNSCIVSLNSDGGTEPGARLVAWYFDGVDTGGFLGNMFYNTHQNVVVVKGQYYWVEVQPLNSNSDVYWAYGYTNVPGNPPGDEYQVGHTDIDTFQKNIEPDALTVEINAPSPPYTGPAYSAALCEDTAPDGPYITNLGATAQTPLLVTAEALANHKFYPAIINNSGAFLLAAAVGVPGYTFGSFSNPSGFSDIATMTSGPGYTRSTATTLVTNLDTSGVDGIAAARVNTPLTAPAGASIKSFLSFDGNGSTTFFTATLAGTGINARNSTALFASTAGTLNLLAQKGQSVNGKTVTGLTTLVNSKLSPAAGRWRLDDSDIGVLLTFSDKSSALYSIPASATSTADWTRWVGTGDTFSGLTFTGAKILAFGLPGFGPDEVAASTLIATGSTGKNATTGALIQWSGASTNFIAIKGSPAPDVTGSANLPSKTFLSFGDPICTSSDRLAFPATLNAGSGIWWTDSDGVLRLAARTGDTAADGGTIISLDNFDYPANGNGMLFIATITGNPAFYATTGETGLFSASQASGMKLIARPGGEIFLNFEFQDILAYSALTSAPYSAGTQRNFETPGTVDVMETLKNGHTIKHYLLEIPYGN